MGQLPLDDPGDDLGVAVRVLVETGAGRQPFLVAGDERAEAQIVRVVVRAEGEGVPGLDAGRRGTARIAFVASVYLDHPTTVAPAPESPPRHHTAPIRQACPRV